MRVPLYTDLIWRAYFKEECFNLKKTKKHFVVSNSQLPRLMPLNPQRKVSFLVQYIFNTDVPIQNRELCICNTHNFPKFILTVLTVQTIVIGCHLRSPFD